MPAPQSNLKWYNTFIFLFGAILGFADPVTDLLTLTTFYHTGHTTWFGVGLVFIILPCFLYVFGEWIFRGNVFKNHCSFRTILWGFNPFAPAITRLRAFIFCCKNFHQLWRGNGDAIQYSGTLHRRKHQVHMLQTATASLFEAVIEGGPQFIIQLHAMSFQEEPIAVIQMISLPVSFLNLVWSLSAFDFTRTESSLRLRFAIIICNFCLISGRLFAVTYFVLVFKWWVIAVLGLHSSMIAAADLWVDPVECTSRRKRTIYQRVLNMCLVLWLRPWNTVKLKTWILWLYYVTYAAENCAMILAYYFTGTQHLWYSLPITISVCIVSVLGSGMILIYSYLNSKLQIETHLLFRKDNFSRVIFTRPVQGELSQQTGPVQTKQDTRRTKHSRTIQNNVMFVSSV